jgi:hypothetical protein
MKEAIQLKPSDVAAIFDEALAQMEAAAATFASET